MTMAWQCPTTQRTRRYKDKIRGIYAAYWAKRVRSMQHWSNRLDSLCDGGACRLATLIGGLACSRFEPRQRSVIFIHAVEIDHGLAPHLVGPDPLVGDQLISLSLSEFAIAATILELDEPAQLVVIIVNHGSCVCFVDFRHNRIKSLLSEISIGIPWRNLGVDAGLPGRRWF